MKASSIRIVAFSTVLALALLPVSAKAQDLRVGMTAVAKSIDPHFYNVLYEKALMLHLYDRLVEQTPDTRLAPGLATSWKAISATQWEFRLRPDVTWQDGTAFSADDVVFTFGRVRNVPNSTGGFGSYVSAITKIEIAGDNILRLTTREPAPTLPNDLANVAIVSRHAGADATTEDYNSGKAAIGTGPYRLVSHTRGEAMELVRNPNWWGPAPAYTRVFFRAIPQAGSRTAALLSGDVDLIDFPAVADLPRLRQSPTTKVVSADGTRSLFLAPDLSRASDVPFLTDDAGQRLPTNPLRDRRVRMALSLATNRQALAERVLDNTVRPTGQFLNPGMYSYVSEIDVPRFDPVAAKKILTEAGYPNGFRITIHAEASKSEIVQAIAQMWNRVGVKASVETVPPSSYIARAAKQDFAMSLHSWASNSGEASNGLLKVFGTAGSVPGWGSANFGRYSNPALDGEIARALATMDDGEREPMLQAAVRTAFRDLGVIPLYQEINTWASRANVSYAPRADGRTVAMSAHP
jgi:peptide/nickel transport system substrate-binding protein